MTELHHEANNPKLNNAIGEHSSAHPEFDQEDAQMFSEIPHILRLRDEALQHAHNLEHRLLNFFVRPARVHTTLEENRQGIAVLVPPASAPGSPITTPSRSVTISESAPHTDSEGLFLGSRSTLIRHPASTIPLGIYSASSLSTLSTTSLLSTSNRALSSRAIPKCNHCGKRPRMDGDASQCDQNALSSRLRHSRRKHGGRTRRVRKQKRGVV
ncbi:hypothetical protein GGS21DRAFT_513228 [Xylaria nigripes]|nr:hypothetical protein GGS21DRAFT_513228 [Xylaria nigripes]